MQRLNRARTDPTGEGQRLAAWLRTSPDGQEVVRQYGINPDQVASDMAAFPAVPPLVFDPDLLAAARGHSNDIAAHGGNGPNGDIHAGYDGSQPYDRVKASGYTGGYSAECAVPAVPSLDTVHASYLVDWGVPDFGHRKEQMDGRSALNVAGIGEAQVSDGFFVDTEDYGMPVLAVNLVGKLVNGDVAAFLTGVVYSDDNGNGQYDPGEGIAGVTVSMDGGKYSAVTSASGGYALPLVSADGSNADGTVPVRMAFADGGLFVSTAAISRYEGEDGSYRANVEWDATVSDDQLSPDPSLPYFGGSKTATVSAGGVVKLKVFRPAESDLSQPYTVNYRAKGSAVAGVNYAVLPTTITVPAGERKAKVKIATLTGGGSATTLKVKLRGVSYRGTKAVTITP